MMASRSGHGNGQGGSVPNPPAASTTWEHQQQQKVTSYFLCTYLCKHMQRYFFGYLQMRSILFEIGANTEIITRFVEEKV